jgi:putative transposase
VTTTPPTVDPNRVIASLTWVDWFNNRRLQEPIGNIPPAEAEERFYAMLSEQKRAA